MSRPTTWLVIVAILGFTDLGMAQTIGPGGGLMAPGPSQPRGYTPGGTGAGGVTVAPGPAARGVNVERDSPGGRLAPGPAGSVSTAPGLRTTTTVAHAARRRRQEGQAPACAYQEAQANAGHSLTSRRVWRCCATAAHSPC